MFMNCFVLHIGIHMYIYIGQIAKRCTSPVFAFKNKTNHPISSNSHPIDDRQQSNIHPQNRKGVTKPTGTSYNFDKVWSGASDGFNMQNLTKPYNRSGRSFERKMAAVPVPSTRQYKLMRSSFNKDGLVFVLSWAYTGIILNVYGQGA